MNLTIGHAVRNGVTHARCHTVTRPVTDAVTEALVTTPPALSLPCKPSVVEVWLAGSDRNARAANAEPCRSVTGEGGASQP